MKELRRDPIVNAIYGGIKKGIQVTIEHGCFDSAVILILSGMDSMAYLNMPAGQEDVTKNDFVAWVERYIKFPCKEQLTGLDLYGARCSMLHSFGTVSKLSREGKCRLVSYMDKSIPEVRYNPAVSKELVLVSVPGLAEAFFIGLDIFLVDLLLIRKRLKSPRSVCGFMQKVPAHNKNSSNNGLDGDRE
jgi:hypothetical protein